MSRDARGTGARDVMGSEPLTIAPRSRAALVVRHEDDWGRVRLEEWSERHTVWWLWETDLRFPLIDVKW